MKLSLNLRRKGIQDFPLQATLNDICPTQEFHLPSDSWGIVTATNRRMFIGFQLLCFSILRSFHDADLLCYDVGMTASQLDWCVKIPNLKIVKYENPAWAGKNYWEAWAKPFYILDSPFDKCLWIDADAMVLGNLNEIIEAAGDKPLFTEDYSGLQQSTINATYLYTLLPIDGVKEDSRPYLNTGVFLLDKKRDEDFIDRWCYCVDRAMSDSEIVQHIACWDQGACKWSLQRLGMLECIVQDKIAFNFPDLNRQYAYPPRPTALEYFFNSIRSAIVEKAIVLHWMGSPKPWERWNDLIPLTLGE